MEKTIKIIVVILPPEIQGLAEDNNIKSNRHERKDIH